MAHAPFVIVTATTETIRGRPRVRLNEAYTDALAAAGLVPLVLPPVEPRIALDALAQAAGLVLTGGEDVDPSLFGETRHAATGEPHAARDACELALARAAFEQRTPTLAICRGAQVMNVALGGTLVQDIASDNPKALDHALAERRTERMHGVSIEPGSALARVVGATRIATNSSHHQSVRDVAPPLRITARGEDGIVEAIEPIDPAWWMLAVQWHPEELVATPDDWDRRLFAAFAHAAGRAASAPRRAPGASDAPAYARLERTARRSRR
jgi:putative glutamine amidotransferase